MIILVIVVNLAVIISHAGAVLTEKYERFISSSPVQSEFSSLIFPSTHQPLRYEKYPYVSPSNMDGTNNEYYYDRSTAVERLAAASAESRISAESGPVMASEGKLSSFGNQLNLVRIQPLIYSSSKTTTQPKVQFSDLPLMDLQYPQFPSRRQEFPSSEANVEERVILGSPTIAVFSPTSLNDLLITSHPLAAPNQRYSAFQYAQPTLAYIVPWPTNQNSRYDESFNQFYPSGQAGLPRPLDLPDQIIEIFDAVPLISGFIRGPQVTATRPPNLIISPDTSSSYAQPSLPLINVWQTIPVLPNHLLYELISKTHYGPPPEIPIFSLKYSPTITNPKPLEMLAFSNPLPFGKTRFSDPLRPDVTILEYPENLNSFWPKADGITQLDHYEPYMDSQLTPPERTHVLSTQMFLRESYAPSGKPGLTKQPGPISNQHIPLEGDEQTVFNNLAPEKTLRGFPWYSLIKQPRQLTFGPDVVYSVSHIPNQRYPKTEYSVTTAHSSPQSSQRVFDLSTFLHSPQKVARIFLPQTLTRYQIKDHPPLSMHTGNSMRHGDMTQSNSQSPLWQSHSEEPNPIPYTSKYLAEIIAASQGTESKIFLKPIQPTRPKIGKPDEVSFADFLKMPNPLFHPPSDPDFYLRPEDFGPEPRFNYQDTTNPRTSAIHREKVEAITPQTHMEYIYSKDLQQNNFPQQGILQPEQPRQSIGVLPSKHLRTASQITRAQEEYHPAQEPKLIKDHKDPSESQYPSSPYTSDYQPQKQPNKSADKIFSHHQYPLSQLHPQKPSQMIYYGPQVKTEPLVRDFIPRQRHSLRPEYPLQTESPVHPFLSVKTKNDSIYIMASPNAPQEQSTAGIHRPSEESQQFRSYPPIQVQNNLPYRIEQPPQPGTARYVPRLQLPYPFPSVNDINIAQHSLFPGARENARLQPESWPFEVMNYGVTLPQHGGQLLSSRIPALNHSLLSTSPNYDVKYFPQINAKTPRVARKLLFNSGETNFNPVLQQPRTYSTNQVPHYTRKSIHRLPVHTFYRKNMHEEEGTLAEPKQQTLGNLPFYSHGKTSPFTLLKQLPAHIALQQTYHLPEAVEAATFQYPTTSSSIPPKQKLIPHTAHTNVDDEKNEKEFILSRPLSQLETSEGEQILPQQMYATFNSHHPLIVKLRKSHQQSEEIQLKNSPHSKNMIPGRNALTNKFFKEKSVTLRHPSHFAQPASQQSKLQNLYSGQFQPYTETYNSDRQLTNKTLSYASPSSHHGQSPMQHAPKNVSQEDPSISNSLSTQIYHEEEVVIKETTEKPLTQYPDRSIQRHPLSQAPVRKEPLPFWSKPDSLSQIYLEENVKAFGKKRLPLVGRPNRVPQTETEDGPNLKIKEQPPFGKRINSPIRSVTFQVQPSIGDLLEISPNEQNTPTLMSYSPSEIQLNYLPSTLSTINPNTFETLSQPTSPIVSADGLQHPKIDEHQFSSYHPSSHVPWDTERSKIAFIDERLPEVTHDEITDHEETQSLLLNQYPQHLTKLDQNLKLTTQFSNNQQDHVDSCPFIQSSLSFLPPNFDLTKMCSYLKQIRGQHPIDSKFGSSARITSAIPAEQKMTIHSDVTPTYQPLIINKNNGFSPNFNSTTFAEHIDSGPLSELYKPTKARSLEIGGHQAVAAAVEEFAPNLAIALVDERVNLLSHQREDAQDRISPENISPTLLQTSIFPTIPNDGLPALKSGMMVEKEMNVKREENMPSMVSLNISMPSPSYNAIEGTAQFVPSRARDPTSLNSGDSLPEGVHELEPSGSMPRKVITSKVIEHVESISPTQNPFAEPEALSAQGSAISEPLVMEGEPSSRNVTTAEEGLTQSTKESAMKMVVSKGGAVASGMTPGSGQIVRYIVAGSPSALSSAVAEPHGGTKQVSPPRYKLVTIPGSIQTFTPVFPPGTRLTASSAGSATAPRYRTVRVPVKLVNG